MKKNKPTDQVRQAPQKRRLFVANITLLMLLAAHQSYANIASDPFILQNIDRANFEPGGQYHLFGRGRGVLSNQQGSIGVTPVHRLNIGNLALENATIEGSISYDLIFSDHTHDEHSPFDHSHSASKEDTQGQALIGFTSYSLNWQGLENHPADAYDGEKGSGHPTPTGARDEYTYTIKGQASSVNINLNDSRDTTQRFSDRFGDAVDSIADIGNNWNELKRTDDNLNPIGNIAKGVGEIAKGVGNAKNAVAAAIGGNDAAQGLGVARDIALMESMRPMSPSGHYNAINQIAKGNAVLNSTGGYFDNLADKHPNTAAVITAAVNVVEAFGAGKGKPKATAGSKLCSFHGNTLVPTISGYKPINKITASDQVLSKNETTGQVSYQKVLNHYNNYYNQSVYITIADNKGNTQTIISNTIHPFFTKTQDGSTPPVSSEGHHYQGNIKDGYWVDASNLKAGDQLLSEDNTWQTVKQVLLTDEPLSAYNLSVNHNHTYFVAGTPNGKYQAFGVWVHNDCFNSVNFNVNRLPSALKDSANETISHINKGTKPNWLSSSRQKKWGTEFKNINGDLPKKTSNGNKITYNEYDIKNTRDNNGAGIDRIVVGSDGRVYYTGSHYGDTGGKPFVRIK